MINPPQVRPEEPTAVTPHGGICGGKSQQWLSYPTKRAPWKTASRIPVSDRGSWERCFRVNRLTRRRKPHGDQSMTVKRGSGEHARPDAPQGPRDMVKAGLLEPQSPATPCCMDRCCGRTDPPHAGSHDADVLRAPQLQHSVEHVGRDSHLARLSPVCLRP